MPFVPRAAAYVSAGPCRTVVRSNTLANRLRCIGEVYRIGAPQECEPPRELKTVLAWDKFRRWPGRPEGSNAGEGVPLPLQRQQGSALPLTWIGGGGRTLSRMVPAEGFEPPTYGL